MHGAPSSWADRGALVACLGFEVAALHAGHGSPATRNATSLIASFQRLLYEDAKADRVQANLRRLPGLSFNRQQLTTPTPSVTISGPNHTGGGGSEKGRVSSATSTL